MATKTYNTGRVVGWSAYEEFLKQHPDVDPNVVTEQIYSNATTFGVTRTVNLQLSGWSGTNILTKTVAVPGAVWGTVPIAGVYYDALSALSDNATGAANREKVLKTAKTIFACYCSNSSGVKLANATQTGGYITFCAYPEIVNSGLTELPLIIRGLGIEGLLDGHAYLGPEGLVDSVGGGQDIDTSNLITNHHLTTFKVSDNPEAWAYWFDMKFAHGTTWISGLSFASDPNNSGDVPYHYSVLGLSTDTTTGANAIDVELTSPEGSLTSESLDYTGYMNWSQLISMLVLDRKAKFHFQIKKMDTGNPTYIDITRLFATKAFDPTQQQYSSRISVVPFHLTFGSSSAYPLLSPWYDAATPSMSPYDGYYRVVMKLYPSPLGTTSKFELLILGYLKNPITLTASGSDNWMGEGCCWRGKVSDDCYNDVVSRYSEMSGHRDQMSLISNSIGSVSGYFEPSDARIQYWDTVPEATSQNWGKLNYLMRKSFQVTSHTSSWQLDFTIKGSPLSGSGNDRLYGIDHSCASDGVSADTALSTVTGYTLSNTSYTWNAASSMESNIADFSPNHASFFNTMSGIYTTI